MKTEHLQKEAKKFFEFATRLDLDDYNCNTKEGIHTTSIAAAWMNIVYGFGGLRSDKEILSINPIIIDEWESYSFKIKKSTIFGTNKNLYDFYITSTNNCRNLSN